jgi:hypothetical protein
VEDTKDTYLWVPESGEEMGNNWVKLRKRACGGIISGGGYMKLCAHEKKRVESGEPEAKCQNRIVSTKWSENPPVLPDFLSADDVEKAVKCRSIDREKSEKEPDADLREIRLLKVEKAKDAAKTPRSAAIETQRAVLLPTTTK